MLKAAAADQSLALAATCTADTLFRFCARMTPAAHAAVPVLAGSTQQQSREWLWFDGLGKLSVAQLKKHLAARSTGKGKSPAKHGGCGVFCVALLARAHSRLCQQLHCYHRMTGLPIGCGRHRAMALNSLLSTQQAGTAPHAAVKSTVVGTTCMP
jgi:hypothetical protein